MLEAKIKQTVVGRQTEVSTAAFNILPLHCCHFVHMTGGVEGHKILHIHFVLPSHSTS